MGVIIEFLQNIGNAIIALVNFIGQFLYGTLSLIETFVELIPALPAFFTWLPAPVIGSISTILGLAICYRIFGMGD